MFAPLPNENIDKWSFSVASLSYADRHDTRVAKWISRKSDTYVFFLIDYFWEREPLDDNFTLPERITGIIDCPTRDFNPCFSPRGNSLFPW